MNIHYLHERLQSLEQKYDAIRLADKDQVVDTVAAVQQSIAEHVAQLRALRKEIKDRRQAELTVIHQTVRDHRDTLETTRAEVARIQDQLHILLDQGQLIPRIESAQEKLQTTTDHVAASVAESQQQLLAEANARKDLAAALTDQAVAVATAERGAAEALPKLRADFAEFQSRIATDLLALRAVIQEIATVLHIPMERVSVWKRLTSWIKR